MKKLIILSLAWMLTACGSDDSSIPFTGSNKIPDTPVGLTQKSLQFANECLSGDVPKAANNPCNSEASQIIRRETMGLQVDAVKSSNDRYNIKVSLHYSAMHDQRYCSIVEYNVAEATRLSGTIVVENFGEIKCLEYDRQNKRCKSLFLEINKTPSSVADREGKVSEGTVFVILENRSAATASTQVFTPTNTEIDYFLPFPDGMNTYCLKPSMPVITNAADILYSIDTTSDLNGTTSPYYDFSNSFY